MRTAVPLVVGVFLLVIVSCSSVAPVVVRAGDICDGCRRPIQNVKIAAEIVPPAGSLPMKFRTVSCLARYLHEHGDTPGEVYVTDYENGRLIQARSAIFVKSEIDENTKELGYYAFSTVTSAVAFGRKSGGSATDWPAIRQRIAVEGAI
jgi:hypothetical protein